MLKLVYIFEKLYKRRCYQIAIFLISQALTFLPFSYESFNYLEFFILIHLMLEFSPYYVLRRVDLFTEDISLKIQSINYQSVIFGILYLIFGILSLCVV